MESGTTTIETNIRNFIKQQMARHNTPGLAIAVTDRDSLLMMETYGYANIDLRQITAHHLLSHTASLPLGRDDLPPSRYAAAALAEFLPNAS